jgi:hypothetical protein
MVSPCFRLFESTEVHTTHACSLLHVCSERHINGHLNLQVKPPIIHKFAEVLTLLAFGRRLSRLSAEPWLSSQRFP